MNRYLIVIVFVAGLCSGLHARAQSTVQGMAAAAESTVEANFVKECSKHIGRMKLFPGDTFDAGELCRCSFKKIEGNARMMEFLPRMPSIDLKLGSAPAEYRYHAAKLFSAMVVCKGAQLDRLADSGALEAREVATAGAGDESRSDIKKAPRPTFPSYDHNSVECRPTMPAIAIQTGAMGDTRLEFMVEKTGRASKFWILRSSGDTFAHKVLDLQAVAAMAACTFTPALLDGNPVDQKVSQEFRWTLE